MTELPGDLEYTDEHEWLRREEDGRWKVVFDKGCPHCSD